MTKKNKERAKRERQIEKGKQNEKKYRRKTKREERSEGMAKRKKV